jgi:5-methylcytosine-specific restriction endonuclease McrA
MKEGEQGVQPSFNLPEFFFNLFLLRLLIMKEWAESFYGSPQWKATRQAAKSRDAYLCVDCMRAGIITPAEEVHHIIELTPENINDPSISLNLDNLVSLCRECHQKRHGAHARRYKFDELGRVKVK